MYVRRNLMMLHVTLSSVAYSYTPLPKKKGEGGQSAPKGAQSTSKKFVAGSMKIFFDKQKIRISEINTKSFKL